MYSFLRSIHNNIEVIKTESAGILA